MTISSRTPEGFPSRCPLCGAATNLEFSDPASDAPCPNCGHLLWFSTELLATFRRQLGESLGAPAERITPETAFAELAATAFAELGADSLDTVELLMELQEEFDVVIPDDVAEKLRTVGDLVRYIEEQSRDRSG